MSVLGLFFVDGRGSVALLPLLVGAVPFVCGCEVSVDISRSVPDDCDMLRGRFLKAPFKPAEVG